MRNGFSPSTVSQKGPISHADSLPSILQIGQLPWLHPGWQVLKARRHVEKATVSKDLLRGKPFQFAPKIRRPRKNCSKNSETPKSAGLSKTASGLVSLTLRMWTPKQGPCLEMYFLACMPFHADVAGDFWYGWIHFRFPIQPALIFRRATHQHPCLRGSLKRNYKETNHGGGGIFCENRFLS